MGERYLCSVRLQAERTQGFERLSSESVRQCELMQAQCDIIAALGNMAGMKYKQLGERILITKGTLTDVIERLEQKGLVARARSGGDKRPFVVSPTASGEHAFERAFRTVAAHRKQLFAACSDADFDAIDQALPKLKHLITDADAGAPSSTPPPKEVP